MQNLPVLSDKHQEILSIYDDAIQAAHEAAHEKAKRAVAVIIKGKALIGESESSPLGMCRKIACIAAVTVAAGYGANLYIQNHGLTFGEATPTDTVNIAEGYAPAPDPVIADADRKPVAPVLSPTAKPGCSPKLTGAALAWCQKQKLIAPLHLPQKNSENIEAVIRRNSHG